MGEKTTTGLRNQSSPPREVIIFGSGACAQKIADNLSAYGIKACLAAKENTPTATAQDEGARWLSGVELTACRGFAGNFELTFRQQDTFLSRTAPAIVVAEDDHRCPAYAPYGIESGSRVMSISRLEAVLAQPPTETGP